MTAGFPAPFGAEPTGPSADPWNAGPADPWSTGPSADPWGAALTTDQPPTEFIGKKDLHGRDAEGARGDGPGRLLAIVATKVETMKGDNGQPFTAVRADVCILDGPTTEMIPVVPAFTEDVLFMCAKQARMLERRVGMPPVVCRTDRLTRGSRVSYSFRAATPEELAAAPGLIAQARNNKL